MAKKTASKNSSRMPVPDDIINSAIKRAKQLETRKYSKRSALPMEALKVNAFTRRAVQLLSRARVPKRSRNPFSQEVLSLVLEETNLIKHASRIRGARPILENLAKEYTAEIINTEAAKTRKRLYKEFLGRACSVIKKLREPINRYNSAQSMLDRIPELRAHPTAIIVGAPNVGKSTLLNRICGSNAKVAPYPFTTTDANLGYASSGGFKAQFLDTPGLSPDFSHPSRPERIALAAMEHAGDFIIFTLDVSGRHSLPLDVQFSLLHALKSRFKQRLFVVVLTKCDIASAKQIEFASELLNSSGFHHVFKTSHDDFAISQKLLEFMRRHSSKSYNES
jgi:small GTP-binding protein